MKQTSWTRNEWIGLVTVVVAVVTLGASITTQELRRLFGLDENVSVAPSNSLRPPVAPTNNSMRPLAGGSVTLDGTAPTDGGGLEIKAASRGSRQVDAFLMDINEVTVEAYRNCVDDGMCSEPDTGEGCNWRVLDRAKHPVNCVDLQQARNYCSWSGNRLPTEEEWVFAARGNGGRLYPWGTAKPENQLCWSGVGKRTSTCPVGAFPAGASPEGIQDLQGNVSEWTSRYYNIKPLESIAVVVGASWIGDSPFWLFSTIAGPPEDRNSFVGFRCAR